jgi:hypothetical protein
MEEMYHGATYSGVDKNIKDTKDFGIPDNDILKEINDTLSLHLEKGVKEYLIKLNDKPNYKKERNYDTTYEHLTDKMYLKNTFMIQIYKKGKGKYIYHEDGSNEKTRHRVLTYLWYLNDVEEGGETDFFGGSFKVKPEKGKLLLFPACWAFPHRGNQPISHDKYIITGWLYRDTHASEGVIPIISPPLMKEDLIDSVSSASYKSEELDLLFEHFYYFYRDLFYNYKKKEFEGECIHFITPIICDWIQKMIQKEESFGEIKHDSKLVPIFISLFEIISDYICKLYENKPILNIRKWMILKPDEPIEFKADICIQINLGNGTLRFGSDPICIPDVSVLFLVEYSFQYRTKRDDIINIFLKDIAEPFLDRIA